MKRHLLVLAAALFAFSAASGTALAADWVCKTLAVSGEVGMMRGGTAVKRPLSDGDFLYAGDVVETGPRSSVKLLLKDETVITLGSWSGAALRKYDVDYARGDRNVLVGLISGSIRANVKRNFAGKDSGFVLQTPTAVSVTGKGHLISVVKAPEESLVVGLDGSTLCNSRRKSVNGQSALSGGKASSVMEGMAPSSPAGLDDKALAAILKETTSAGTGGLAGALDEDNKSYTAQDLNDLTGVIIAAAPRKKKLEMMEAKPVPEDGEASGEADDRGMARGKSSSYDDVEHEIPPGGLGSGGERVSPVTP